MPNKVDKVIVTNVGALKTKYGAGFAAIQKAINDLITTDNTRGLQSRLIALDDKSAMASVSGTAVTKPADPRQNKAAVDAIYKALAPDYILLLGASDIISHQDLKNPMYNKDGDDDPIAWGDVPYACEAPYSPQPHDFVGPTRVVGRLPDIVGVGKPDYLVTLLNNAANYKAVTPSDFTSYFAVSAAVWQKSTDLSITNTFGNTTSLGDVPPKNYKWTAAQLKPRPHFFNCHGAALDSRFFGQPASGAQQYPVAFNAAWADGKVPAGAVVAAECCYGGQLFDPAKNGFKVGEPGICNIYLKNGGWGFFGSTTIAYGPSEGNGQADLICQFFLQRVMAGASLGRAALEARQKFVATATPPDPSDIKTLAQYNLYGDPSLTPVDMPQTSAPTNTKAVAMNVAQRSDREDRRRVLFRHGISLEEHTPIPRRGGKTRPAILNALRKKAREFGIEPSEVLAFAVRHHARPKAMPKALAAEKSLATAYHVLFGKRPERKRDEPNIVKLVALIGKEVDGELVSVSKIHSR